MEVIRTTNYEDMSLEAAKQLKNQVETNPRSVLGLATGSTPLGTYRVLVDYYQKGLDFTKVTTFNLDEYLGLAADHPASYRYFMEENLFSKINVPAANINIPNGVAPDVEGESLRYENLIQSTGGIDLQILGIGTNGHIGFNEPGTPFGSITHAVELTASTRESNARFFSSPSEVPTHAISMGIKSIMQAKKIVLLASGQSKAEAIAQTINGEVTPNLPASVLQLHPNVVVIVDQDAAALI